MFVRHCGEATPHKTHVYRKQWVQEQMEKLGMRIAPSGINRVWTVTYRCQGTR